MVRQILISGTMTMGFCNRGREIELNLKYHQDKWRFIAKEQDEGQQIEKYSKRYLKGKEILSSFDRIFAEGRPG